MTKTFPYASTGAAEDATESLAALTMQRSVTQLLFSYLPGKFIDWEEGIGVIKLTSVLLNGVWSPQDSGLVLDEVAAHLDRWRAMGGAVPRNFPDPARDPRRFAIGEPESISGTIMDTALQCMECGRLFFYSRNELMARLKRDGKPYACAGCGSNALRQFPQIFVHGCGHVVHLGKWMPTVRHAAGNTYEPTNIPLVCKRCGEAKSKPAIHSRSERARDLIVVCDNCGHEIIDDRLSARCHECLKNPPVLPEQPASMGGREPTIIKRILMRATSYRASDAYYPHSLTILRLDRPPARTMMDPEVALFNAMMPEASATSPEEAVVLSIQALTRQMGEAQARGDGAEVQRLMIDLAAVAAGKIGPAAPAQAVLLHNPATDIVTLLRESIALKTTVRMRPYVAVLSADVGGATVGLLPEITEAQRRLRLRPIQLVEDLPVISATFGFSRRSFEPTYEEDGALLPTQIMPFYSLDNYAAQRLDNLSIRGTTPILAREGEHEGIFLGLDPDAVVEWLAANGIALSDDGRPAIARILEACESMDGDRYYDRIFERRVRRLVFGVVHSLSHTAMRVVSRYAGLERTSLSEYLFPPLLGTVIYANSSSFKFGCIETMIRSNLHEFLNELNQQAMTCPMDTDCLDHDGSCPGCLDAPEICCRVFNHGLSRAFLIGGHVPWADLADARELVGYWDTSLTGGAT